MPNHQHDYHEAKDTTETQHKDQVCGMTVTATSAKGHSEYGGKIYYFCNPKCKTKFDANPAQYLKEQTISGAAPQDVEYTCPMHPQIRQIGPGSCPICG